jgi:transcriptional regulator GlxA family with amidase domain
MCEVAARAVGDAITQFVHLSMLDLADTHNERRSITDIAFSFGFSNMAHFSRVLRSQLGVPPSDYRRMAGGLSH